MDDYPYMDEFEYIDYCIANSPTYNTKNTIDDADARRKVLTSGDYEAVKALMLEMNRLHPTWVKDEIKYVSDQQLLYELACNGVYEAIGRMTDQQLLCKYYDNERFVHSKKAALYAMTDQEKLLSIAKSWDADELRNAAKHSLDAEHIKRLFKWEDTISRRIEELKNMEESEAAQCILTEENWQVRKWIARNIRLPYDIVEKFARSEKCQYVRSELLYSAKDHITLGIMARLDEDIYIRRNAEEYAQHWRERNNPYY